jgi:opacity protein-like surface antigen
VLGGDRVWHVSTDFEFGAGILPATRIKASRNWVDSVGGMRGKMALSQKMFLIGKFDLGGGGSQFAWQVFGGAGYNLNPKITLIFGYRVLDVDYDKNNFVYDMNQRGPVMGVGFKF